MKVLQVNCVYPVGSTGKLTREIHHRLMEEGMESLVCYGRGGPPSEEGVRKTSSELAAKGNNLRSRITGIMYGGCWVATRRLMGIIREEKPDIVHLQCINGYFVNIYRLVQWLKEAGIPTVLTLHAEFMYTANCGHALDCDGWRTGCGSCPRLRLETKSWFLDGTARSFAWMKVAFQGFEENLTVVSVSPWLRDRAAASPILGAMDHRVILNGVDTVVFSPRDTAYLRKKHGLEGKQAILHTTAMFSDDPNHLKGGRYLLELAKRLADWPVQFLVAGKYSLSGEVPENVTLLGNIGNQSLLADYYSLADLTLLISKKETFSMPCAESLCCGTPVVGFRAGGPESIALPEFSEFVEPGNLDALEGAVRRWLVREDLDRQETARLSAAEYSSRRMTDQYLSLYRRLWNETTP